MSLNHDTNWMLVVEDQIDLWVLLKKHLKGVLPLVHLVHVANASTALSYLHSCSLEGRPLPQLILSDLYTPQLNDGLGLLTSLKEFSSGYHHLPIVIMSSSTNDQDRQEVNYRGGTYLLKPTGVEEWSEFLQSIHHYWHKTIPH
ncbi:response regulator [Spirosoma lituiforme]